MPASTPAPTGRPVEHEASDVSGRTLGWLALMLVIFVAFVAAVTRFAYPVGDDRDRAPRQRPAGVGLQTDARGDLLAYRRSHVAGVAAADAAMARLATAATGPARGPPQ